LKVLIDGKKIANALLDDLKTKSSPLMRLDVILIGNDAPSQLYVKKKKQTCMRLGIKTCIHKMGKFCGEMNVIRLIQRLNEDPEVNGILVQLPLPPKWDILNVLSQIDPTKDVDGLTPINLGKLTQGSDTGFIPCTPLGCLKLIQSIPDFSIQGKHAVVVGSSFLVGKPMATLLTHANATVTLCHKYTENLEHHVRQADLLVTAVGKPNLIPGTWVKEDSVVLDVGISRTELGLVGDVEFDHAVEKVRAITPVPGGVGPMTVACLMENTIRAFHEQMRI